MPYSGEIWLSVDLSTRAGSLALHRVDAAEKTVLLGTYAFPEDTSHSELLLVATQELLRSRELGLDSVSRLITSSGPGSFTGLRIALSSLKAIATAKKLPLEMVSSSECRARSYILRNASIKDLSVVTRVASVSYQNARFENGAFTEDGPLGGELILVDSTNTQEWVATQVPTPTVLFPSSAEFLGECLLSCATRRTHNSLEELISAAPNYFGSSRF